MTAVTYVPSRPRLAKRPRTKTAATRDFKDALAHRIRTHQAVVAIVGQGYVGLPLATELADRGFTVNGLDCDVARVDKLNGGQPSTPDVDKSVLSNLLARGKYQATADFDVLRKADVIVICVPTPLRKSKDPDISYVLKAAEDVAARFRPGQLVILESTTYPGTTHELMETLFEERGAEAGADFFLAFSPERIDPGNRDFKVVDIPKVVGGVTPECAQMASLFYEQLGVRVVTVSSPTVAELVKLYENIFRNVNIALANELAIMCRHLGIESREVIDAAATKPFGFMPFYPGPGIGGHCIPVDPSYLQWKMRLNGYETRFSTFADQINRSMPLYVVELVTEALNNRQHSVNGASILVLGVAYKRGVGDTRESPAIEIISRLRAKGARLTYADPYVPHLNVDDVRMDAVKPTDSVLSRAHCVLILTDHPDFDYPRVVKNSALVIDTRGATRGVSGREGRVVTL